MPQVACIGIALTALTIAREKESTSKFPEYTYEIFSKVAKPNETITP